MTIAETLPRALQGLLIASRTFDSTVRMICIAHETGATSSPHIQAARTIAVHLRRLSTSTSLHDTAEQSMQPDTPPTSDPTPISDAAPPTKASPRAKYVTYNTKRLGLIRVPDVPLPYFAVGETKRKRLPVDVIEAFEEVKANARANFAETVDLAINLGIDARRGDQNVRGAAVLPHGIGRAVRVAVFAEGDLAETARQAGADVVGGASLIDELQLNGASAINFDKCLASPDMMGKLSKIARLLGPKGMMPSPKLGTVVTDMAKAVKEMKAGRVEFRNDRAGVLHVPVGKVHFEKEQLLDNVAALVGTLLQMRPKGVKGGHGAGGYLLKAHMSSTMGRSIPVSIGSLVNAVVDRQLN